MWLCDIDMNEIVRYGGIILKIHSAMCFLESLQNPFKKIILERYKKRMQYKSENKNLLADIEKTNMCSIYGKTVCKDVVEDYKFITKDCAQSIEVDTLKDWEDFGD